MPTSLAVLIIEDSEDDALLVLRELRRGGYDLTFRRVDTAAAMQAALADGHWDVVISDFSMPQFSGLAALQVLKANGQDVPFIIVSGAIGEDVAVEAMRSGAHDYLMKDKLARLVPAVERELREAEVRRQRRHAEENLRQAHDELEQRVEARTRELAQANAELRRATAQAETANRAKDEFLGVLSHELRNPLTAVLLLSSLLEKRGDLPRDVRTDIQSIRRGVQVEARIIDDLLDVTRIARGKLQFDFQTTDLRPLIRQAVEMCGFGAGAPIRLKLAARAHFVYGDPARLQQVFQNLLSNSRKFTSPQGQIEVRSRSAPGGRIRVQVIDTGMGIEPAFIPHVFTAFEQAQGGGARQFGGLGLGLAISKAIIDAHAGTIAASSPGKDRGATFTLELDSVAAPKRKVLSGLTRHAGRGERSLRILLVDDHESTLNALVRAIQAWGHVVHTATGVQSAIQLAERERLDLLVSDLGLPDGHGHALMRTLQERYGLDGIALSGYGTEEDVRRSKDAGFSVHLTKPVDSHALESAIRRLAGADAGTPALKSHSTRQRVKTSRKRVRTNVARPSKAAKPRRHDGQRNE